MDSDLKENVAMLMADAQTCLRARIWALVGDYDASADILQETNLAILRKAEEYDINRPFLPWAFRFAHIQILKWRTNKVRDRLVFDDELFKSLLEEMPGEDEPSDLQWALSISLKEMSAEMEFLCAKYCDNLSIREIAKKHHMTEGAVTSKLQRLRTKLAEKITAKLKSLRNGEVRI